MGGMGVSRALMSTLLGSTPSQCFLLMLFMSVMTLWTVSFILSARFFEACCTDAVSLGATCLINVARRRVVFVCLLSMLISSAIIFGVTKS